jgi:hypothetical protein
MDSFGRPLPEPDASQILGATPIAIEWGSHWNKKLPMQEAFVKILIYDKINC